MGLIILSQVMLIPILGLLWMGIREERKQMQYEYKKAMTTISFFRKTRRK